MTTTRMEKHSLTDGGYFEVHHEGEITHPQVKHPWKLIRHYFYTAEGKMISSSSYLEGARGGFYYLRPYLGEDTGKRQMISMKSGGEYRIKGNAVQVIEVAGQIEFVK